MTSSRIEGPVSLPPTICAPPDRSRRTQTAAGATRRACRWTASHVGHGRSFQATRRSRGIETRMTRPSDLQSREISPPSPAIVVRTRRSPKPVLPVGGRLWVPRATSMSRRWCLRGSHNGFGFARLCLKARHILWSSSRTRGAATRGSKSRRPKSPCRNQRLKTWTRPSRNARRAAQLLPG